MKSLVSLFNYPKRRLRKLVQEGEYIEALKFGKSLEKKYSDDPDLFFIIASIYYLLGDAKNTILHLEKVLEIKENDVEALLMKANLHLYLKEQNLVLDCCEKISKVDPHNKELEEILEQLEENNSKDN